MQFDGLTPDQRVEKIAFGLLYSVISAKRADTTVREDFTKRLKVPL